MTEAEELTPTNPLEPFILDEHRVLIGDLVLDLALRTISSRSQKTVTLSGNEFVILATLVKNSGRFVPKDDLLVAVAGFERDPHPSIVDTYITYLHRRIQEADSSATIEKATGHGFRLVP